MFNNNPNGIVRSTSYYVQQMFSVNRGSTILPVESDGSFGPGTYRPTNTSHSQGSRSASTY